MVQFTFFALLIITLMAGAFAYYTPTQKTISPLKFLMDYSGYSSVVERNQNRIQKFNISTDKGLMIIRRQMDEIAQKQNRFMEVMRDQQQVLINTAKDATDILLEAQNAAGPGNNDILRLKSLTAQMQDQQRLLLAHGQDLFVLSEQLTKSRQWVAEQVDLAKINTETSLNNLQQRYAFLKEQAAGFFDKVSLHNQEVKDSMDLMRDKLHDLTNNVANDSWVQQQSIKDHIQRMLDKEQEDMRVLAENEEKNKELLRDAQERLTDSRELLNDKLRQNQDMLEEGRQRAQDQKLMTQQSIADQMQRIADQQNR